MLRMNFPLRKAKRRAEAEARALKVLRSRTRAARREGENANRK